MHHGTKIRSDILVFGESWCSWIRHCVSTVPFFMLINGHPTPFSIACMAWERRPFISPVLFVIIMVQIFVRIFWVERILSVFFNLGLYLVYQLNGCIFHVHHRHCIFLHITYKKAWSRFWFCFWFFVLNLHDWRIYLSSWFAES